MPIVKIAEPARKDLEEIWQYVAENSMQAANTMVAEFKAKIELLAGSPSLGRQRGELMLNLRGFPHKKYVIFYFPIDGGIEIFRIIHGSRDLIQEFEEILPGDSIN